MADIYINIGQVNKRGNWWQGTIRYHYRLIFRFLLLLRFWSSNFLPYHYIYWRFFPQFSLPLIFNVWKTLMHQFVFPVLQPISKTTKNPLSNILLPGSSWTNQTSILSLSFSHLPNLSKTCLRDGCRTGKTNWCISVFQIGISNKQENPLAP